MKKLKKCLLFMLIISLTASFMVACKEEETETQPKNELQSTESETETVTETEIRPEVTKKDYDDSLYMQALSGLEALYSEDGDGSVVSEALYNRQMKIADYLGVNVVGLLAEGDHTTYHIGFTNSVKNKDGAIDLFITQPYMAVCMLIQSGYVRDLKTMDGLNLEADHWNREYMDSISLFDRYYLGYSDFNIPKTYVFAYNKDMLEKYDNSLDESIYDTVRGYRWTLDKMLSLASLVYTDATGDGKTADDTFGLTGWQWQPFITFLHSSDIPLVQATEKGEYEVAVYNDQYAEKTTDLINKLYNMAKSDYTWFRFRIEETPEIGLEKEQSLMALTHTSALENLLNYELNFGILPYPLYDEAQKDVGYRTLNYDGNITVPTYLENEAMVADTLELLSFWGEPVKIAFFEKMLGKQVSQTPDDAAMLEIVWSGICSDIGYTYSHCDLSLDTNLYMVPNLTNPAGSPNIASYVQSYEKIATKSLNKFMKAVSSMK